MSLRAYVKALTSAQKIIIIIDLTQDCRLTFLGLPNSRIHAETVRGAASGPVMEPTDWIFIL